MIPILTLLAVSAVTGILGLDSTGALQVMVSRPLVVGGVVGFMLGNAAAGLAIGSLVELLWTGGVPVGSLVPPDGTAAAAVAATVAVVLHGTGANSQGLVSGALGVLAAVPAGIVGAHAEVLQRRITNRLSRAAEARLDAGRLEGMGYILSLALGLAWARGFLVCLLCLGLGLPALAWIIAHLPAEALVALRWCFWLYWLLGLAVVANHFWERRGLKYAAGLGLVLAIYGSAAGADQSTVLALAGAGALGLGVWRWIGARRGEMA